MLVGLTLLLYACGGGEARSSIVTVDRAEWRGRSIMVTGEWSRAISTPPICQVLEGRDGPISDRFSLDARVTLDGGSFSKEFVPEQTGRNSGLSEKREGYYVRCSVSLDSGKSADDTVKVTS
ncbi:hypothetical protein BH24ACT22_BH24ACT22_06640 [soil metagenome]